MTGKTSFDHLFQTGSWFQGKQVKVIVARVDPQVSSRFAVCLGRSIRGAVRRNRYKRILREALNPLMADILPGFNMGVFPAPGFLKLKPEERTRAIRDLFYKSGFLKL